MPTLSDATLTWGAEPKQLRFIAEFAHVYEALYGGAAGGGKSDSLLIYNILRRQKYAGSKGLILRRHFTELSLQGGLIPRSHELLTGVAAWNGGEHTWTFPNGSVLQFGHMQREESKYLYHGSAFEDIGFDELTHFTETQYLYMRSRARTVLAGCRPTLRAGSNPGNVGHGWVKERFIDPMPPFTVGWFKRVGDKEILSDAFDPAARSRVFVPARVEDNSHVNFEYISDLESMPEDDVQALRWGNWDAWSGAVFKRFKRERHVLRPFELPEKAPRRRGLDWGTARPFVCLWAAYGGRRKADPPADAPCDGEHTYVYRELSRLGLLDEQQAALVAEMSKGETFEVSCADPNSFFLDSNQTGQNPSEVFARHGVYLTAANNERIPGKRAVDSALGDCACGVPRLRIFETCVKLIEHLPQLPYDPIRVEDVDTKAADDEFDALRYLLMGPSKVYRGGSYVAEGLRQ